jgi:Ca-activated chloride channel family protein
VPLLAWGYVRAQRRRRARTDALAATGLVAVGPPGGPRVRRHVPFGVTLLALAVVLVAVARPVTGARREHPSGTVVLTFDVSASMLATDVAPTRLAAAQAAARRFVAQQPETVAFGVVAFGAGALVLQQATTARADVLGAIDRLHAGGGTSAGQGIYAALGVIAGHPLQLSPDQVEAGDLGGVDVGYHRDSTIVLVSDGEETGGPDPVAVAQLAADAGVRVSAIGVGTPAGAVLTIDGYQVSTALDEDELRAIARTTGGTYERAAADAGLDDAYAQVDVPAVAEVRGEEWTGWIAAIGAALLVVGAALSSAWLGRVV